jgi:pimeloyl-ACP methyl ester carboxylesterase
MAVAVRERELVCRGLRLLVREAGQGPPVVLAHGMWCEGGMFAELTTSLARDCRVIVPDFRGHGGSEVPEEPWTIRDLALDLVALFDALQVSRAVVAGFSMGGMAALHLALEYPRRVLGLGLISTSAEAEDLIRVAEIRALSNLIRMTGVPDWIAHRAAKITFSSEFRRANPASVARWESAILAMPPAALRQALSAVVGRPSVAERLGEIRVPGFVLTGSADRIVPPHCSSTLSHGLPRARLVVLRGAGHAVPLERPRETAAAIRELL